MQAVKVSPKYQVVIPSEIRKSMGIKVGQKMQVVEYDGKLQMLPERDIVDLRGFLKGADISFKRDQDRL